MLRIHAAHGEHPDPVDELRGAGLFLDILALADAVEDL